MWQAPGLISLTFVVVDHLFEVEGCNFSFHLSDEYYLFFCRFYAGNVLDSFEIFEYSLNISLPLCSFLVSDAFYYLFAQIFQSLFLTFGSVFFFLQVSFLLLLLHFHFLARVSHLLQKLPHPRRITDGLRRSRSPCRSSQSPPCRIWDRMPGSRSRCRSALPHPRHPAPASAFFDCATAFFSFFFFCFSFCYLDFDCPASVCSRRPMSQACS